jgi:hypothetical protein
VGWASFVEDFFVCMLNVFCEGLCGLFDFFQGQGSVEVGLEGE